MAATFQGDKGGVRDSATESVTQANGEQEIAFDRVFVPSLILDHTELVLRQAGIHGHEGFAIWAGTLAAGNAHVATLIVPRATIDA